MSEHNSPEAAQPGSEVPGQVLAAYASLEREHIDRQTRERLIGQTGQGGIFITAGALAPDATASAAALQALEDLGNQVVILSNPQDLRDALGLDAGVLDRFAPWAASQGTGRQTGR